YRSISPIDDTTTLHTSTYLGYVRDHSSENVRKSQLKGQTYFFTIDSTGIPLDESTGLYVTTCTDTLAWYYVLIVENLTSEKEDQTILPGDNSLIVPIQEEVKAPQPILQFSYQNGDVTAFEYVIWGNNTSSSSEPAFNNAGSYGYNFTFFSRGTSS